MIGDVSINATSRRVRVTVVAERKE